MSKVWNLGFIGGGVNSAVGATHFIASRMDRRFKIQAGCFSRKMDENSQTAQQLGIHSERLYSNYSDLLEQEQGNLDAIVVLTPTPSHLEPVVQALRLGYPVICEKALTNSSSNALLIQNVQDENKGFLAVTYNYTGYPMLRELRRIIQQGRLGKVEQIHIEMPQEGYARLNLAGDPIVPQQWRLEDSGIPVISLDLGAHLHHIIDFLTGGKPIELVAMQSSQGRFRQVIDNTICIALYTNSLECSIWYSKAALGYRNGLRVRVFGEDASAEWYQMDPEFLIHHDNMGRKTIIDRASVDVEVAHQQRYNRFKSGHPAGFLEAFANHYWDIADSLEKYLETGLQETTDYVFTAQHALEGLIMLETMTHSSRDRCWKSINFEG